MAKRNEKDFYDALEAARKPMGSGKHPFSLTWIDGGLSRTQLGQWAVQHYYYISAIPQQFAALYARMPDAKGRALLMENLVGEEMPETPEKSHPNLLLKFAKACGVDPQTVIDAEANGEVLGASRAMRAWIWELATIRPMHESCAGIMVALEGQLPTLFPGYISAMEKMGFSEDELEFFHVHVENDVEHARIGLELCNKYAETVHMQNMAIEAVRGSASLRYSMLSQIHEALQVKKAA